MILIKSNIHSGRTIFIQLSFLLSMFLFLIAGSYIFINNTIRQQQNNGSLLNAVSLQKTLLERYTRHAAVIVATHATDNLQEIAKNNSSLLKNKQYIETNYNGLLRGGEIILSEDGSKKITVKGFSDETIKNKLLKAQESWETLKGIAVTTLQSDAKTMVKDQRYDQLEENLLAASKAQDEAIYAINVYMESKIQSLIIKQKVIFIAGIVMFLLTLVYTKFLVADSLEKSRKKMDNHEKNLEMCVEEQTKYLCAVIKEIEEEKHKAELANHTKSEFLANMSHELRTPLNSIMGFTRMFQEDTEMSHDNRQMAITVHRAATSLLDMVNDILDIAKIESGIIALEKIGFDFKEVVTNIVDSMAPIASGKGISLKYGYENNDLPYVIGDPFRVSRILTNLVSNAIKYTNAGEVNVTVDSKRVANNKIEIICLVRDTGIGIAGDKIDKIFDKFAQADETITRKFGGTGLGLTITKDLVAMMGGIIEVKSEVGKGSTFQFKIPFEITDEINEERSGSKFKDYRQKRKVDVGVNLITVDESRILVAEDHILNQDFIKRLMRRMGFKNFKIVENGIDAIKEWQSDQYDLILMDCHMPELNGYEATQKIRKLEENTEKHIPIIALTADAMKGTQEKCAKIGMDEYVTKPIDSDELRYVLEQWIVFPEHEEKISETTVVKNESKQTASVDMSLLEEYAETPEDIKYFSDLFIQQSQGSIDLLSDLCVEGESLGWVESSHKLKGGAAMIGAIKMQQLCEQSQNMFVANSSEREAIFCEIKNEYESVKQFLVSINAS